MPSPPPKLLLGIGNLLRGDDGVGVEVAGQMARLPLPADVEVFDGGTAGLHLAAVIEGRERVVVIDAVQAGGPAGSVYRFTPESLSPGVRSGLSTHDLHFLHALDETRLLGTAPREVIVLAVQVADTSPRIGLSAPVQQAVRRVIALALQELGVSLVQANDKVGQAEEPPAVGGSMARSCVEMMP